jgi:hypothetical protein
MIQVDTKTLEMHFAHTSLEEWELAVPLMVAYHTSRVADALERIANQLENGQIATLREGDIVAELDRIGDKLTRYER